MEYAQLTAGLRELGLTSYEAKAYEAAVKLGKTSAAKISLQSGVPYGKIYETLRGLVSKGLIRVIPEKSKMFSSVSPKELVNMVRKKRLALDDLEDGIKKLENTFSESSEPKVFVAEGERNFWKLVGELPKAKKYNYNITHGSTYIKQLKRKAIYDATKKCTKDLRALEDYSKETAKSIAQIHKIFPYRKRKKLPFRNEGVAGVIQDDTVVLLTLINANTTILIKDRAFAKMMRHFFLSEWDMAEAI